jgi:predicted ATP-dependent Lon-type protease
MSLGGNIVPVDNLAESLQVAFDAGAKRILLPMASVKDIPTIGPHQPIVHSGLPRPYAIF